MTKLAIISHARSGTGYAAALLQACGLDIGHERLGKDGIVSHWWATPESLNGPARPEDMSDYEVIQLVREPARVVDSVRFTEPHALPFRCQFADINWRSLDPLEHAVDSVWSYHFELIPPLKPTHVVATERFTDFCQYVLNLPGPKQLVPKTTNTRARTVKPLTDRTSVGHHDLLQYPRYMELHNLWTRLNGVQYS